MVSFPESQAQAQQTFYGRMQQAEEHKKLGGKGSACCLTVYLFSY